MTEQLANVTIVLSAIQRNILDSIALQATGKRSGRMVVREAIGRGLMGRTEQNLSKVKPRTTSVQHTSPSALTVRVTPEEREAIAAREVAEGRTSTQVVFDCLTGLVVGLGWKAKVWGEMTPRGGFRGDPTRLIAQAALMRERRHVKR